MDRNKNRATLAGGIVAIALVAAACGEAVGPNASTVDNGYTEVKITTPASVEPAPPIMEETTVETAASDPTTEEAGDTYAYNSDGTMNSENAESIFLMQLDTYGIECGDRTTCLEAGYITCMFLMQGGDTDQLYMEMAMDPYTQVIPQVSNDNLPYVMGAAEASICEAV